MQLLIISNIISKLHTLLLRQLHKDDFQACYLKLDSVNTATF